MNIDYAKLAIATIDAWEEARQYTCRSGIEDGMDDLLELKYKTEQERAIISDVLEALTGKNLNELIEASEEIDDDEL